MAENQTPRKSKEEMTCFVVIGFGMKTDFATGRTMNLDLTYTKLIKPAFDIVGIRCFRAIDINVTGSIDKLMYNWIYQADFVIADLSTMNANVFYELGVRHAQCPKTTLIMAEHGLFKKLPFDLSHTIIYGYEHLGEDIADEEAKRFVGLLSSQVQKLLDNPVDEDSPVYVYMPGMKAPTWIDPKELIADLEARLAEQQKLAEQAQSGEQQAIDPEALKKQSMAIIVNSAEAAKNRKDFPTAISLFKAATENDEQDMFLWQRLALVTYKNKEKEEDYEVATAALQEAEQILIDHCELSLSTDPETLGLAGAINKRLFERTDALYEKTGDKKDFEQSRGYFGKSVYYYERGFYIKQDYYNGINVAYMYTRMSSEFIEAGDHYQAIVYYGHGNLIRRKVAEICIDLIASESFAGRGDKEWVYQTLAQAYLGMGQQDEAEKLMPEIQKLSKGEFDMDTFLSQNQKLVEAMETFERLVQVPTGDGADVPAPTPAAAQVAAEEAEAAVTAVAVAPPTTPVPATAAAPRVHQTPEGSISIDLGNHRGQIVKSVEVNCKIEFE